MDDRETIKKQLETLKEFYTNLLIYALISIICIVIWISMGFGAFWPIWVIFGLSISAFIQAVRAGQLPKILEYIPFLKPEWENEQIERLLQNHDDESVARVSKTKGKKVVPPSQIDPDDTIHA